MASEQQERMQQIQKQAAYAACKQPLLQSGLWFQHDIRDNFYAASYLFAVASNPLLPLAMDRREARQLAKSVFLTILSMQDSDPLSPTYGHWPLRLLPTPDKAAHNPLPAELMGILMAWFFRNYEEELDEALHSAFHNTLTHLYNSPFHRKPLSEYGHHEAKYTAAKLIYGHLFNDKPLLEDGQRCLQLTLRRIQNQGMHEYSSLPWFWHWLQAFNCAFDLVPMPEIRKDLQAMLDFLWTERSHYYLKGAWAGAHCRGLAHDVPKDSNVLFDYVQFGDFPLPERFARIEYAGFLSYMAPAAARQTALDRSKACEVRKRITRFSNDQEITLHSYLYVTKHFAAGGMWERSEEFDNEQHRWDVTLPLEQHTSVNQAYFFHPGTGYHPGDPRHQSACCSVLYHQNAVAAHYVIPSGLDRTLIGTLPLGEWITRPDALYGHCGQVYMAIYIKEPYIAEQLPDRTLITSEGAVNSVLLQVTDLELAQKLGLHSLSDFAAAADAGKPEFNTSEREPVISYTSPSGDRLMLHYDADTRQSRSLINGEPVDFSLYQP